MRERKRRDLLGRTHAEQTAGKLRGGAAFGAVVGFLWLLMGASFPDLTIVFWGSIYFAFLCGTGSLIALATALQTQAHNALFRDRDEMMSAIRILEQERLDRHAKRGDFQ